MNTWLSGLNQTRDQLLRQFMLTKGAERTEIITKIIDLDEEIQKESEEMQLN